MKTAYSISCSPAVYLDRCILFAGIYRQDSGDKSLVIIADSLSKHRKSGTVRVLCYCKDDLAALLIYILNSQNTNLKLFHLVLKFIYKLIHRLVQIKHIFCKIFSCHTSGAAEYFYLLILAVSSDQFFLERIFQ